ncbi:hypothetical protein LLE98_06750 [Holdemanella porci]|uniref:hypothetical protein n=1 Tax=Holdemanella porci TaxID=2652276 RepID=UPI001D154F7F|nr:hypothetical protein [Holdemanella porci]MCC3361041.1 hypothetical protein [Holdemanella porci]
MKRLLGVVLVLFMACVPMNIHAQEVDLSFDYSGHKVEIGNAIKYYTIEGELLDEAPIDCGTYIAWTSDEEVILFEINPKKVPVKVTYNKDWRENDSEEEKYLCEYVGDYEFKLRIDADGNINSLDNYLGNYDFQFEPKNVKDVKVLKTKITHPDVEYVYSEDGIEIYSDIDQVEPILLRDVGEYTVAFNLDERYYESVPFKVTILPKTIELKPNKQFKYFGEEDPVLENDDYILTREPGEDIGDYKLTVQSKSKNYKYEIIENDVFSILGRDVIHRNETKGPSPKFDKEVEKTTHEETSVLNKSHSKITTGIQTKTFTYSITLIFSLLVIFIFIFKFI